MRRRNFVAGLGLAGLSASVGLTASRCLGANNLEPLPYLDEIGLQLWTVRNQMQQDAKGTLEAIAKAGYYQVELMDAVDGESIAATAKSVGLQVRSAFFNWEVIARQGEAGVDSMDKIIEVANRIGLKHLVFGYIGKGHRETIAQYQQHADRCNAAGEKCSKAGIQLCYHNHSFEFAKLDGDQTGYDVFIERFDKKLVKFEVDVFWVKIGGWDPIATMKKLAGRISQVHLKDLLAGVEVIHDEGKVPADAFQELGDGVINMSEVLKLSKELGVAECHVEQDQSNDPLQSIRQSLGYLKKS